VDNPGLSKSTVQLALSRQLRSSVKPSVMTQCHSWQLWQYAHTKQNTSFVLCTVLVSCVLVCTQRGRELTPRLCIIYVWF